ncbi:MAG: hypothetical protein WBO70_01100, partial [Erysipelotrichaceae bacterium]
STMNIVIEEIVINPILQIDNVINEVNIEVSDVAIPGQKGDKGDTGEQGIQGLKGDKGDTGSQGIQGEIGLTGLQGIQGIQGDKGDTGEQGIQGLKGDKGDTGLQGIQGIKGDQGDTGLQGIQGEIGLTGKSAYQSALDGGFVGTELEFNESLANQINFSQVNTYALMLSITVYSKLIIVKVLNDENKGIKNTIYHIYPDGVRMWIASVQDN